MGAASRVLREPLLHFLVIGAGIFALFGSRGDSYQDGRDRIVVDAGEVRRMAERWEKTRMRPPVAAELEGLIEERIREEVFYREALALGLDRDDAIVRRRLRQKMEFITQDLMAQADPTETELQAYLDDHPSAFRTDARFSFRHVFFNRDRRGARAEHDALALLDALRENAGQVDEASAGDPLPLPRQYESTTESGVARLFGQQFAARLRELEEGAWQGPVPSGYGLHLVLVEQRTPGRVAPLEQVRDAVAREWREARRRAANEAAYRRLRARYTVVVERPGAGVGAGGEAAAAER